MVNENVQQACLSGRMLKVLNTGVRVFAKLESSQYVKFRPTEEGLPFLLPYITKRKVPATLSDVKQILSSRLGKSVLFEEFSESLQVEASRIQNTGDIGPILLILTTSFAVPVWLGNKSLGLLVDKATQLQLLELLTRMEFPNNC